MMRSSSVRLLCWALVLRFFYALPDCCCAVVQSKPSASAGVAERGDAGAGVAAAAAHAKRGFSDVSAYAHCASRKKPRRKHRAGSPICSVGSGASPSGFHGGNDAGALSDGIEAPCPHVSRRALKRPAVAASNLFCFMP